MAWGGKALGIGLGYILGGPLGGIVGGIIGNKIDNNTEKKEELRTGDNDDGKTGMLACSGAVFYELASLSGPIPPKVRKASLSVLADMNQLFGMGFSPDELEAAFTSGNIRNAKSILLSAASDLNDNIKWHFYGWLIRISVADGVQSDAERAYIQDFQDAFAIDPEISAFISRVYLYPRPVNNNTLECRQAAELLGISPDADISTIKHAYRKQCMIYHPDHLGDVAPEIRKLAADRFQKISEAYELLTGPSNNAAANLYALDPDTGAPVRARPGMIIRCICCNSKIRIPDPSDPARVRCPRCQALIAFEEEFIQSWISIHK